MPEMEENLQASHIVFAEVEPVHHLHLSKVLLKVQKVVPAKVYLSSHLPLIVPWQLVVVAAAVVAELLLKPVLIAETPVEAPAESAETVAVESTERVLEFAEHPQLS